MENWIGIGIWIVLGALVGLSMKVLIKQSGERPGHATLLAVFGAFGAVIGGMLGVGLFHFLDPRALSIGGFAGAIFLSALLSGIYRWGIRTMA
ncbi:MAG: hypothetical protein EA421_05820 [Gemmatimonadales bacterium]|jgi:hypothetical protein|nr:MAG: hypothetical protein EA421_05820 [Gemmatimonadales bacterium]